MTLHIELIFFQGCPNIEGTRKNLAAACVATHINPVWTEWAHDDKAAPDYVRKYGSPTILVNGSDITEDYAPSGEDTCRIYEGNSGVPGVELIRKALETGATA